MKNVKQIKEMETKRKQKLNVIFSLGCNLFALFVAMFNAF